MLPVLLLLNDFNILKERVPVTHPRSRIIKATKASENNPIPMNPIHRRISVSRFSSPLERIIKPAMGATARRTISDQYIKRPAPEISKGAITLAPTYPYRMVMTKTTTIKNTVLPLSFLAPE